MALEIPVVERGAPYPVSVAQASIWRRHLVAPAPSAFNVVSIQRLRGTLDRDTFAHAWRMLVARHEPLRTTFRRVGDSVVQFAEPARLPDLRTSASIDAPKDERERILQKHGEENRRTAFLFDSPPVSATLIPFAADDHGLILVTHQLLTDCLSFSVLLDDLLALYQAAVRGGPADLSALPIQYLDYAIWQAQQMGAGELRDQVAYWLAQPGSAPVCSDVVPRPATVHRIELSRELVAKTAAFARSERSTARMAIVAAASALLARLFCRADLLVGAAVSGRCRAETQRIVGPFANVLPLRIEANASSARDLVRGVRAVVLRGYANQEVPCAALVPMPSIVFATAEFPGGDARRKLLRFEPIEPETATTVYDIGMTIEQRGDAVALVVAGVSRLAAATAALRDELADVLDRMVEAPSTALFDHVPTGSTRPLESASARVDVARSRNARVASGDEVERAVMQIWEGVLEREIGDPDSDFFEVGGDSLAALRIMVEIEHRFGCRLPPSLVFDACSVTLMAREIRERRPKPA